MLTAGRIARVKELVRFYQAAAVNAAFGFGLYSLFVYAGANALVAQLVAHCIGVAFNYLTYSRHVFRNSAPAKFRFIIAYAINYLVGLTALLLVLMVVPSPYVAGFIALIIASAINFFALKYGVFIRPSV